MRVIHEYDYFVVHSVFRMVLIISHRLRSTYDHTYIKYETYDNIHMMIFTYDLDEFILIADNCVRSKYRVRFNVKRIPALHC